MPLNTHALRYVTDADKAAALAAVDVILKGGFSISVSDGEERVLEPSTDAQAIIDVMGSTEMDGLSVWRGQLRVGTFMLIYGMSDAEETIADWSWRHATPDSEATMEALHAAIISHL